MSFPRFAIRVVFFSAVAGLLGAESLWTPGFKGYLSAETSARQGDVVTVVIDASSSLSFEASSDDAKSITLEFSGGEFGNLFSFLPLGRTGGTQSVQGAQKYEASSEIAARVAESDAAGAVRVQGSRAVSIQGREEQLIVSGWLDPNDLGAGRRVRFSQLSDSRLSFRTFLEPAAPVLTAADIEQVVAALGGTPAPGAGAPAAGLAGGAAAAAGPGAAAAPPQPAAGQPGAVPPGVTLAQAPAARTTTYTLSDAKKVELFLQYINRLVDVLFQ
jgi:hypothetical protein